MCPHRRGGLVHKVLLRGFSSKSRCQAMEAGSRHVHITARPSVQLQLGGGTTRRGAPRLLVRVEPTGLIINPLTAENKPPVLAVYWAGDEAVTGHPVPSTPQGGEKRETVSELHLRKIPPEFLAASFTSVAANATGSPANCRCRTLPSGLDVSTGLLSSPPPHNSPSQCPQKQKSPLRSV